MQLNTDSKISKKPILWSIESTLAVFNWEIKRVEKQSRDFKLREAESLETKNKKKYIKNVFQFCKIKSLSAAFLQPRMIPIILQKCGQNRLSEILLLFYFFKS